MLQGDHLRNELRMMRKIRVHQNDKFTTGLRQSVNIGGSESQLSGTWSQNDFILSVLFLQTFCDVEGAVWRRVVDDYYLERRI